ncbi:DNA-directed RNA polymerase I, II, and III subunit RPABC3 [Cryptococcus neoformans c45]|nr:DNA-directed RNA polymerase I, II, and III subunit RPABC3 [Cryptococcus neoformans var. grubii c45]
MAESSNIIFDDRFTVDTVDKDGKKFDRGVCVFKVSRITATSHSLSMSLTLDIANELYPVEQSETFTLTLARSLVPSELEALDNNAGGDEGEDGSEVRRVKRELWRSNEQGLAEDYDYVMYGKIYKFDDSVQGEAQTTAYFSFGGLLMALRGSYRHLAGVVVGENVYLLMRK